MKGCNLRVVVDVTKKSTLQCRCERAFIIIIFTTFTHCEYQNTILYKFNQISFSFTVRTQILSNVDGPRQMVADFIYSTSPTPHPLLFVHIMWSPSVLPEKPMKSFIGVQW